MATDEAPWTTQYDANAGKTLGLCCKHKANGILESNKGLGGMTQSYLDDLNALIYGIFFHLKKCHWMRRSYLQDRSTVMFLVRANS